MQYKLLDNTPEKEEKQLYRYKVITTLIFVYTWINLGITNCVISSTLPDFRRRIGITNEEYGRMIMIVIMFATVGSLIGGVIADRLQSKILLFLAISQACSAIGHGLLPWSLSYSMATLLHILRNVSHQFCNAVGSAYIVSMWGMNASLWIHLLHAGYPIGCVLGPIVTGPFLSRCVDGHMIEHLDHTSGLNFSDVDVTESSYTFVFNTGNIDNSNATNMSTTSEDCIRTDDTIEWPYLIGSSSLMVSALLCFFLYFNVIKQPSEFRIHRQPTQKLRDACNPNTCTPGRPVFGVLIISASFFFYACLACVEGAITNTFLFTYAVEGKFKFSNKEADYLDIAFKGSMLLGRLMILPLTHFVPIQVLLLTELFLTFVCSILLAVLGTQTRTFLWVFSCLFNFILAPLWPAGYSWFNRYASLYAIVISATDIFTEASYGMTSWIVGHMLDGDSKHQNNIWTLNAVVCGALFIVMCVSQLIARTQGERIVKEQKDEDNARPLLPTAANDIQEHCVSEDEF